jgi:hypothetical protein
MRDATRMRENAVYHVMTMRGKAKRGILLYWIDGTDTGHKWQ